MNADELARRFAFHPTGDDQVRAARHERIRAAGRALAELLVDLVPDCRERSIAVERLEEAVMWGNAGLARPPAQPEIRSLTVGRIHVGNADGLRFGAGAA